MKHCWFAGLAVVALAVSGCFGGEPLTLPEDPTQPTEQPSTSAACRKTGCSNHICSDQDVASTCEWRESYACYQTAQCERQADGNCGFTMTAELQGCLSGS